MTLCKSTKCRSQNAPRKKKRKFDKSPTVSKGVRPGKLNDLGKEDCQQQHGKTSPVLQDFYEMQALNPWCPHGPTLKFERSGKGFYACSAFRQRKDCNAYFTTDETPSSPRWFRQELLTFFLLRMELFFFARPALAYQSTVVWSCQSQLST